MMINFTYHVPTRIIFGKGTEDTVGEQIVQEGATKVLLHFGGGNILKSGLYDRIIASLKKSNVDFIELGGVQPNPRLSKVKEGIALCKDKNVDFILAVGGGSVIDSSKAISIGCKYEGDVWDFYAGKAIAKESLPIGAVLTIAAAGSEMSDSSVISDEDSQRKYGYNSEVYRPKFAIMNPELTFTLPPYQTACGIVDIMAHIMERYFTNVTNVDLTDRLCEAGLKTMIKNGPAAFADPLDYDARAEIMWTGSLAHNGLMGTGRIPDFGSHKIEHELSAKYDIAHGAGLAIVFPAWMKYVYRQNINRFAQFANRVFDVEYDLAHLERTVLVGIERLEMFYRSIGMPTRLCDIGVADTDIEELARLSCMKTGTIGGSFKLDVADVEKLLWLAAE